YCAAALELELEPESRSREPSTGEDPGVCAGEEESAPTLALRRGAVGGLVVRLEAMVAAASFSRASRSSRSSCAMRAAESERDCSSASIQGKVAAMDGRVGACSAPSAPSSPLELDRDAGGSAEEDSPL